MDIVWLKYWNEWTGQCPASPWKLSMDSVDIVHGLIRKFPWTQWTLSMDIVCMRCRSGIGEGFGGAG